MRAAAATEAERRFDLERLAIAAPVDGVLETLPYRLGEQPPAGLPVEVELEMRDPG